MIAEFKKECHLSKTTRNCHLIVGTINCCLIVGLWAMDRYRMKCQQYVFSIFIAILCLTTNAFSRTVANEPQPYHDPEAPMLTVANGDDDHAHTATSLAKSREANDINADALIPPDDTIEIRDPFERFNRAMFHFNDKIDTSILKPVAKFYNAIMPKPLNKGVHNVFNNLNNVTSVANDLLQLHFVQAANDLWRIAINTTVGIGGLFDIGDRIGLKQYNNDFGLTFSRWGWRRSTYVVLPFWGSKTIRDTAGMPVDWFYLSIYPYIYPRAVRWGVYGVGVVDNRAQLLEVESIVDEAALDKYIFLRSAYMQHRDNLIKENLALGFTRRYTGESEEMVNTSDLGPSEGAIDVTAEDAKTSAPPNQVSFNGSGPQVAGGVLPKRLAILHHIAQEKTFRPTNRQATNVTKSVAKSPQTSS